MFVPPEFAWKLVLAVALFGAILAAAWAKAPSRAVARGDLRWLVAGALGLYGVAVAASLTHHSVLSAVLYAAAVAISALAAWLSRGVQWGEPPPDGPGGDEPPPAEPRPSGPDEFDWVAFERDFRAYERRHRTSPTH